MLISSCILIARLGDLLSKNLPVPMPAMGIHTTIRGVCALSCYAQSHSSKYADLAAHPGSTITLDSVNKRVLANITALAGDHNIDGIVDAADYTVWRDTLGSNDTARRPTATATASIDSGDYDVWKSNFGNHSGSGASANAAVPEPATLWLLLAGILTMCCSPTINGAVNSSTRDTRQQPTVFGTVWLGVPKPTCRRVSDLR